MSEIKYRYKAQIQNGELARLNKLDAEQNAEIERLRKTQVMEIHIDEEFYKECQYEMRLAQVETVKKLSNRLFDKSKNGNVKTSDVLDCAYEVLDELS